MVKPNRSKKISIPRKKEIIALPEKVASYVSCFDSLTEGGFEKNSANLLVGSPGSGKTIFAVQSMIGAMDKGEKCLYVTFEEKRAQFFKNMLEFGWDLVDYEKKGLLTFIEYTPAKVKTMLDEGGGEIENVIVTKKITRIVIDSITSFELLFDDELAKREASLSLFSLISSWNCTSLLTYEDEPAKSDDPSARALQFEADSIINIYFVRVGKGVKRERFLEILKMRGAKHSKGLHALEITNKGFVISRRPSKVKL
jgi:circadian clock protein KaiC